MSSNYLIFHHPLLLLSSIFPNIGVFSNALALHIRWPKYWSFSISPPSGYSGLISFSIDYFDHLADQGACWLLIHFNRVWLFLTLWTVAPQAPLSMRFSRQESWVGCCAQGSSSRGSSPPRDWTWVSYATYVGRWVLHHYRHLTRVAYIRKKKSKQWLEDFTILFHNEPRTCPSDTFYRLNRIHLERKLFEIKGIPYQDPLVGL